MKRRYTTANALLLEALVALNTRPGFGYDFAGEHNVRSYSLCSRIEGHFRARRVDPYAAIKRLKRTRTV